MRKLKILAALTVIVLFNSFSFAQEELKPGELAQQAAAAKDSQQAFTLLQQSSDGYFKDAKFNEFFDLVKGIGQKNKSLSAVCSYFCGLSRYQQLKYLEEKQSWDEYFNKGNDYRGDITSCLAETVKSTTEKDPLQIYGRVLLWQFHQDQQDAFAEGALADLEAATKTYAASSGDPAVIKYAADKLGAYEQKGKARELYKLYIGKVVNAELKDEQLMAMALGFFKDGNLELAEAVYDAYINKVTKSLPKADLAAQLAGIAAEFAYKDGQAGDPAYAEKIFQKIEELAGKEAFNEQLSYLRAYNLERSRDYAKAKAVYMDLLARFPQSAFYDKGNFKLGIISVYGLRDLKTGREFFQKLAGKESVTPEVEASLYQLGLLAQWEDDLERAKANYLKLKEKAGAEYKLLSGLCDERLKEIEEGKLLDANLRDFLDVSLKDEYSGFNMSKLELKSSVYNLKKGQEFTLTATAFPPESGCMQLVLNYGWVGDFGKTRPALENSSFTSAYSEPGTKVIGLVVRTSGGVIDRAFDMIDVE